MKPSKNLKKIATIVLFVPSKNLKKIATIVLFVPCAILFFIGWACYTVGEIKFNRKPKKQVIKPLTPESELLLTVINLQEVKKEK